MNRFKQFSVGRQVSLIFGTLCTVLLLIGGLFYFSLRAIERSNEVQQSQALNKLALIDDAAQDVGEMQAGVLRQVLASDLGEIKRLEQAVRDVEKINAKEMSDYRTFVNSDAETLLYDRVGQARKVYWEQTQPLLTLGLSNRNAEATELINAMQAPAYDAYLKSINELIKYVEADAESAARGTARVISRLRVFGDALAALAILMTIGTGFAVAGIGRQLKEDNRLLQIEVIERKRAEETLRESEEKFQQLAEHITDVFWITSPDFGTMHYISAGYALIWGRSTESLYRNPHQWVEAILPEERARVFAVFDTLREKEAAVSIEYRIVRPDGAIRWVHDRGFQVRDVTGTVVRLAGIVTDITERRRTEESLRLLSSAVEQSRESIIITDAELDLPGPTILFVNPAFTRMTGHTAAEAIGKTPRILQGTLTDRAVLDRLRRNLQNGEAFEGETLNYRKDGTEFNLEWQIAPIRDSDQRTTHFVAIQRDVTERRRLEAKLSQSQKMETVGKLAGGVAHEFNSILTAIIGQSELLLADLPGGSPMAKSASEIGKAADRAAVLTRQLLAYGRKQFLEPKALDLNRVLASMEGMFRHIMGSEVQTRIVPAANLQAVKADAGQIEQVIVNMAVNARDAMPKGGQLTLETANVSFDLETVGRYPELRPGHYVMLAITDTGIGMTPEVKARAFEPFFSTKGIGQGTGLGLSTCYGIVKQSGGHISVYSELSRGATFKIYLPQFAARENAPAQRSDAPALPRGSETILLVEDDPALREMAATLLGRLGYTVLTAANGIEALSMKQRRDVGHIDLLFTDVVMPHMSGKELADRVGTLSPHTKVLFTSAYTENAIVHQGVLNKGVALLQKPFTPAALAHKLREVLDRPLEPVTEAGSQAPS